MDLHEFVNGVCKRCGASEQAASHVKLRCLPESKGASTEPEFEGDYALFSSALLSLPSAVLASSLALLEETTLFELFKSKASEVVGGSKDAFAQRLDERARELSGQSRGELMLRILGALNEILEVSPRHYVGRRDFEDNAQDIVAKALQILRETEKAFTGHSVTSLVRFHIQKIFDEIGNKFETLSEAEQAKFLAQVREFIQSLPSEQRARLEKELGGGELTNELLTRAITSGALAGGFAALVGVAGFSSYLFAVSLAHGLASLVGLTLPFVFYTSLTSVIHVVANPLFLIALLGGGGVYLYRTRNRFLRQKLVPLVVTQITLAGTANSEALHEDAGAEALALWADASAAVTQARADEAKADAELRDVEVAIKATQEQIANSEDQRRECASKAEALRAELSSLAASRVSEIAGGAWGANLVSQAAMLVDLQRAATEADSRPVRSGFFAGLWDRGARAINQAAAREMARGAARELAEAAEASWKSGTGTFPPEPSAILAKLTGLAEATDALNKTLVDLAARKSRQTEERDRCNGAVLAAVAQRQQAEGRYWGLEQLQ